MVIAGKNDGELAKRSKGLAAIFNIISIWNVDGFYMDIS